MVRPDWRCPICGWVNSEGVSACANCLAARTGVGIRSNAAATPRAAEAFVKYAPQASQSKTSGNPGHTNAPRTEAGAPGTTKANGQPSTHESWATTHELRIARWIFRFMAAGVLLSALSGELGLHVALPAALGLVAVSHFLFGSDTADKSRVTVDKSRVTADKSGVIVRSGVVSFRQRDIGSHAGARYSDRGGMPVQQLSQGEPFVSFCVTEFDRDGSPGRETAVQSSVHATDVYVQEGDMVAVVGLPSQPMVNPAIVNETSGTLTIPGKSPAEAMAASCLLFGGTFGGWVFLLGNIDFSRGGEEAVMVMALLLLIPALLLVWFVSSVMKSRRRAALRDALEPFVSGWTKYRLRNPVGLVEGCSTFSRVSRESRDSNAWIAFRIAVSGANGDVQCRIVSCLPEKRLGAVLRVGDWVQLHGEFRTGEIARPSRVSIGRLETAER
jgi:hypothetical protein